MRYTKEQIDRWIAEYRQSGQTLKSFCEDKPFHCSSFSNWLRKRGGHSSFVEITAAPAGIASMEIRQVDGTIISIHRELSITDIIQLVRC
jgi:hypothetical protein